MKTNAGGFPVDALAALYVNGCWKGCEIDPLAAGDDNRQWVMLEKTIGAPAFVRGDFVKRSEYDLRFLSDWQQWLECWELAPHSLQKAP